MRIVASSRWDPLYDLLALHERLNRLSVEETPGWTPAVDLYETADRFVVSAELPGMAREHIKIEMQQDTLVIRGERPCQGCQEARFHRVERGHGAFLRQFVLPQPVLVDEISAEYDNGVLTVLVPKAAPRSHRVDIR